MSSGGALYLGIDDAERHSAAALMDSDDNLLYYSFLDAGIAIKKEDGGPRPQIHLMKMASWFRGLVKAVEQHGDLSDVILTVENIFPHAMNGIPAARMQGGILLMAALHGLDAELVLPGVWQKALGYSKKEHGKPKPWAAFHAELLGFQMPETQPDGSRMYAKQKEDLPDAFLINHWRRTCT
jgi:hypothetical protein